jgi:SOS response regulatory protein OraA/RecX
VKDEDPFVKKQKTAAYIAGKGFETDLVWKMVEQLEKQHEDKSK